MRGRLHVGLIVAILLLAPTSAWCAFYEYNFSTQTEAAEWKYMTPGWDSLDYNLSDPYDGRFTPEPVDFPYGTATFNSFLPTWYYQAPNTPGPSSTYNAIRFPREGTVANPGFEGVGTRVLHTNYLPFVNTERSINFLQYHVIKADFRADRPDWNSYDAFIGFYVGIGHNRYHYILEAFDPQNPWSQMSFDLANGTAADWWQFSWDPVTQQKVPFQMSFLNNPDEFGWLITADPSQSSSDSGDIYMGYFSADVPAPSALVLLPIGLAGALLARKRRRAENR